MNDNTPLTTARPLVRVLVPRDPAEFLTEGISLVGFVHVKDGVEVESLKLLALQAKFDDGLDVFRTGPNDKNLVISFDSEIDVSSIRLWFTDNGYQVEEMPMNPEQIEAFSRREMRQTLRLAA